MSDLYWLTDGQMARLQPYFSRSHGKPRGDDRRVLSGIVFVNRNGLRWRDAPIAYGSRKTLHNRWKRWSERGAFLCMMEELAAADAELKTIMIDAIYLKLIARHRACGNDRLWSILAAAVTTHRAAFPALYSPLTSDIQSAMRSTCSATGMRNRIRSCRSRERQ